MSWLYEAVDVACGGGGMPFRLSHPLVSSLLLPALQNNAGLHGLSPGDETNSFIAVRRQQLKLLNAALLASLSLAARGVDAASQALIGVPVGCLSLLLLASTVTSAARQVRLSSDQGSSPGCAFVGKLVSQLRTRRAQAPSPVVQQWESGGQQVVLSSAVHTLWCHLLPASWTLCCRLKRCAAPR